MVFVLQEIVCLFFYSINLSAQKREHFFVWFHLIERMKVHIFTTKQ